MSIVLHHDSPLNICGRLFLMYTFWKVEDLSWSIGVQVWQVLRCSSRELWCACLEIAVEYWKEVAGCLQCLLNLYSWIGGCCPLRVVHPALLFDSRPEHRGSIFCDIFYTSIALIVIPPFLLNHDQARDWLRGFIVGHGRCELIVLCDKLIMLLYIVIIIPSKVFFSARSGYYGRQSLSSSYKIGSLRIMFTGRARGK